MQRLIRLPFRYTDAKHMLVQEAAWLDFVDIATTVQSHRALVELVVSHGVGALICQKPLVTCFENTEI